jgi:ligand-binding SRPBCC domain-containing protein
MTVLENSIHIAAPPEKVWAALAALDQLHHIDPGVRKSVVVTAAREGVGAARQCDLAPGGWFREKVAEWRPGQALAFELFECTLPVRRLGHRYTFTATDGGTLVSQRMEYVLKYGVLGQVLDALMVRRKWDAGIKTFFAGLKRHVETGSRPSAGA